MLDHAAFWVVVSLSAFFLGYRFYSRFIADRLYEIDDDTPTPAHTLADGVDYVPTNKHVLLGHHFTSIAGAAPIVGPAVACVHGWGPALLWIVLGVIFIGAVHDFGALVVSVRHQGKSIGDIAGDLVGPRARTLFLCLIVVLTWLVLAAFASIIAILFVRNPATVLPINIEIPIAVGVGWWYHKRKGGILAPSILALAVMWGLVFVTAENPTFQLAFPAEVMGFTDQQVWIACLLTYSFVTCILPVWVLLQPRDFINSHQLFLGLGALLLAILVANPELTAPAFNDAPPDWAGPVFPLLFVTIACGAISGFHSLVSSGTTSKQISSLRHSRAIGYGGMIGEGCLALVATMAVAAGFSAGRWEQLYTGDSKVGGIGAFVEGAANLLKGGFGEVVHDKVAQTIVAVVVISFAATTLDTACRIQRFCLGELGKAWNVKFLTNRYIAAAIAAFTPILLCLQTGDQALWRFIWPVFGAANQMLGAIALLLITLWLKRRGKPLWFTGIPAVFLTVITVSGLITIILGEIGKDADARSWAVLAPAAILLVLAVVILWEGVDALVRRKEDPADSTA